MGSQRNRCQRPINSNIRNLSKWGQSPVFSNIQSVNNLKNTWHNKFLLMKKIFKILVITLMMLVSPQSFSAMVYVRDQMLIKVGVEPSGDFLIYLQNVADPICYGGGKTLHVYDGHSSVTIEGLKGLLAMSTTALAAQRYVDVQFENATAHCFVRRIDIK